jgi:tRNA U34 2-thiouridine synthase MnmA/TrmU
VTFERPHRRVAPGQSVVLYRGDEVLGGGIAA